MKYEGIDGNVKQEGYKNWIELYSFGPAELERGMRSGQSGTKMPGPTTLLAIKATDRSSNKLMQESLSGVGGKNVTVIFLSSDGKPYLRMDLEGVMIVRYQFSQGRSGPDTDSFELSFAKIGYFYLGTSDNPKHTMKTFKLVESIRRYA